MTETIHHQEVKYCFKKIFPISLFYIDHQLKMAINYCIQDESPPAPSISEKSDEIFDGAPEIPSDS